MKAGDTFGDYKVVRRLGKGGMGEVWLLQSASGGLVAAKILDPETAADHEARRRFLREAQLALGVKHPNLVETYDVGEDPETGLCYILMEYVPGGTLADYLATNGALAIDDAVAVVEAMAAVLELGRQRGIVHRDIKPANIMFASDGTPKLADLGIARGGVGGTDTTTVTQTGVMIGTPAYMSPEQMLDAHHVDTRADIYSLGVVFFEMLTGERPNKDDTIVQLMAKAVKGEPLPDVRTLRPEVSASLAQLLNMMVAPDKDGRISTPGQITNALAIIARGGAFEADTERLRRRREEKRETLKRRRERERRLLRLTIVGVSLFALVSIGSAAWFLFGSKSPSRASRAPSAHVERPQRVVRTNVVEKVVATTSVVEKVVEKRETPSRTVPGQRPENDSRPRIARIGDHEWKYTIANGKALIWRGAYGDRTPRTAAVSPSPVGHVTVPAELDGYPVSAIGYDAFCNCDGMTTVKIPEGVERINAYAFVDCKNLRSVDLPESLRGVQDGAFLNCPSLERVDFKDVSLFSGRAFSYCKRLDTVAFPPNRTAFTEVDGAIYADEGRRLVFWPRTRQAADVPEGVATIGKGAFCNCAVRTVRLPKSLRKIEESAFAICDGLDEMVFEEGLVEIGPLAFWRCSALRRVVFPSTLKLLGYGLFDRNGKLERVAFWGNAPRRLENSRFTTLGNTPSGLEILVLGGTSGWKAEGSTELPSRWPDENLAESRPVRTVSAAEMEQSRAKEDAVVAPKPAEKPKAPAEKPKTPAEKPKTSAEKPKAPAEAERTACTPRRVMLSLVSPSARNRIESFIREPKAKWNEGEKRGCLVCGSLDLAGAKTGEIATSVYLGADGSFALALYPQRRVTFLRHGYEPLVVDVPASREEFDARVVYDLGHLKMRKLERHRAGRLKFAVALPAGVAEAKLQIAIRNGSPVRKHCASSQIVEVPVLSRKVSDGQQIVLDDCAQAEYRVYLDADGCVSRKVAECVRAGELHDVGTLSLARLREALFSIRPVAQRGWQDRSVVVDGNAGLVLDEERDEKGNVCAMLMTSGATSERIGAIFTWGVCACYDYGEMSGEEYDRKSRRFVDIASSKMGRLEFQVGHVYRFKAKSRSGRRTEVVMAFRGVRDVVAANGGAVPPAAVQAAAAPEKTDERAIDVSKIRGGTFVKEVQNACRQLFPEWSVGSDFYSSLKVSGNWLKKYGYFSHVLGRQHVLALPGQEGASPFYTKRKVGKNEKLRMTLAMAKGLANCEIAVMINRKTQIGRLSLTEADAWVDAEIDLAAYAGKTIRLDITVASLEKDASVANARTPVWPILYFHSLEISSQ